MAQIRKGRLVKGPYKPICRDCAIYFSTTVPKQPTDQIVYHPSTTVKKDSCGSLGGPPATPSTRPSTASTRSCTTPERGVGECGSDVLGK